MSTPALPALDILLGNPVRVETGTETLSVQGVQMRDLDEFTALCAPLTPLLRARQFIPLLSVYPDEAVALAARACGRDADWLREQDAGVLMALMEAIVMANPAMFAEPDTPAESSPEDPDSDWTDVFQRLIAAGHRASDLPGYTFSQVHAYCRAIDRATASDLRLTTQFHALAARYAGANDKTFKQFQESLRDGS